jgi:hypothetical protein
VFYLANTVPRDSTAEKRFQFRVAAVEAGGWSQGPFATKGERAGWRTIAELWQTACFGVSPAHTDQPFPLQEHEAPWLALSLSAGQCRRLLNDAPVRSSTTASEWEPLGPLCDSLAP